jgi:hypothetical protein
VVNGDDDVLQPKDGEKAADEADATSSKRAKVTSEAKE